MNSIIFGVIFWVVLLGAAWAGRGLARPARIRPAARNDGEVVCRAHYGDSPGAGGADRLEQFPDDAVPHVEWRDHRETHGRD